MEFLTKDIQNNIAAAQQLKLQRQSRLRVHLGDDIYPILQFWQNGFALSGALTPHLRGLVDIFDGARHEFQCLIIASLCEGSLLICDFKRATRVAQGPALDYVQNQNVPSGYLPRH